MTQNRSTTNSHVSEQLWQGLVRFWISKKLSPPNLVLLLWPDGRLGYLHPNCLNFGIYHVEILRMKSGEGHVQKNWVRPPIHLKPVGHNCWKPQQLCQLATCISWASQGLFESFFFLHFLLHVYYNISKNQKLVLKSQRTPPSTMDLCCWKYCFQHIAILQNKINAQQRDNS